MSHYKKDARLKWVNFWDAGFRYFKALENNIGQYTRLWYLTLALLALTCLLITFANSLDPDQD